MAKSRQDRPKATKATKATGVPAGVWGVLILVAVIGAGFWGVRNGVKIRLSSAHIQSAMEPAFPLEQKDKLFTLKVEEPKVLLPEGADRIGVEAKIRVRLPIGTTVRGKIEADTQLRYDASASALYLTDPKVKKVEISGVNRAISRHIAPVATSLLRDGLQKEPVYTIPATGTTEQILRRTLRDVRIVDGTAQLTFGL